MNMGKKPAQLGDNLLSIRPRKGEAKPQTEQEAANPASSAPKQPKVKAAPVKKSIPRRRKRLSDKTAQLNIRVSDESLDRFTKFADDEGMVFGDLFKKMLDKYDTK